MVNPTRPHDYRDHSAFSDPGQAADGLRDWAADPVDLHRYCPGVLLHYRADPADPTPAQWSDIDRRWVSDILTTALSRGPSELAGERAPEDKVGGCCRDFSLVAVAALREAGVPARTRIGFAGYFDPLMTPFHVDHVIGERWNGDRWVRFDPQLRTGRFDFDVTDLPVGRDDGFWPASEVWQAWRNGELDERRYGVAPDVPELGGAALIQRYVILELAHLMKVETLLWDEWGPMSVVGQSQGTAAVPEHLELTDRVAGLIIRATGGDAEAGGALERWWRQDVGLRPGRTVQTWSPRGRIGHTDLTTRQTIWADGGLDLRPGGGS